jgi:hypothetical protein
LSQAMGSGVRIKDLRIEEPNLEDVFVALTTPAGGR